MSLCMIGEQHLPPSRMSLQDAVVLRPFAWISGDGQGILPRMGKRRGKQNDEGYVLAPSVTHPQGRERAFEDAFKAMARFMIEVNDNPTVAYAIDKTDRIVTEQNRKLLSEEDLAEWDAACDEFDSMSDEEQDEWIENVLESYPSIERLPDLDSYNHIN